MPLSPGVSMTSLLQVDLASLGPDVVAQYASKVVQLQPPRTISHEKLQMLFVLSQKLLRWFVDERASLEHVNERLEQELLETLQESSPEAAQCVPAQDECVCVSRYLSCQADWMEEHRMVNQVSNSLVSTRQPVDAHDVSGHAIQPHAQSDLKPELSSEHDAEDGASSRSEASVSYGLALPHRTMDANIAGTEPASLPPVTEQKDEESETYHLETQGVAPLEPVSTDATQPAQQILHEDETQLRIATIEHETMATPASADSSTLALDASVADTSLSLCAPSPLSLPAPRSRSPLEVYHQVHSSVIRLQKLTRGYLTRRRFFRMLEDLVMKSCS